MRCGLASMPGASRSPYAAVQALTSEKGRRAGGVAATARALHRKYRPPAALSCGAPTLQQPAAVDPAEPGLRASQAVLVQVRGPGWQA